MRGQILAVHSDTEVLIKHEDINGFMPAMTMPYKVRNPELLQGKAAGDLITATIAVSDTDAWLTRIDTTGNAPIPDDIPPAALAPRVPMLEPGDEAPGTALTDETGATVSLADWKGSAVAVTFIYTRCPLPQFCPLMDRRFKEVQNAVKNDSTLNGRVHLVSASFDPDHDTPDVLRTHAKKLEADPSMWHFVTAPREDIDAFAAAFGVSVMREADNMITHNLRTAVLDLNGRMVSVYGGSDWTPEQIVSDLRRALSVR